MIIPSSQSKRIKEYERALFHVPTEPRSERVYVFYLLLRPILEWAKKFLKETELEACEIESELFLLSEKLFKRFDPTKSSIIPYLQNQLPWEVARLTAELKNRELKEEFYIGIEEEGFYYLEEEFYLSAPKILFEEKYLGKDFTKAEKYLIYIILTVNDNELTQTKLASYCNVERKNITNRLSGLREKLESRGYYGHTRI